MAVKVVTDSLADLPKDLAKKMGIEVVPLYVLFGQEEFKDGVTLMPDEFYARLEEGTDFPKTAVPTVGEFAEVYDRIGKDADGIVSIHLSSKVSGTFNSAQQGAKAAKVDCPIEVVDSLQVTMAVGLIVVAAARAAEQGGTFEDVVKLAKDTATRSRSLALMDTMEYLERGGRIGKAAALVGSLLNFKPMLEIKEGAVNPFAKPRTRAKGIQKLKEYVSDHSPVESICVMHATTPEEAQGLLEELKGMLGNAGLPMVARYGPGLGTHVGPGGLGVVLIEASQKS